MNKTSEKELIRLGFKIRNESEEMEALPPFMWTEWGKGDLAVVVTRDFNGDLFKVSDITFYEKDAIITEEEFNSKT